MRKLFTALALFLSVGAYAALNTGTLNPGNGITIADSSSGVTLSSGANGSIFMGYYDLTSISEPLAPSTGFSRIYSVIDGGTGLSVPYFRDESGASYAWGTGGGSGSVTEVSTSLYLTVDGTPGASITTSGTLDINHAYLYYNPAEANSFSGGAGNITLSGDHNSGTGGAALDALTTGLSNACDGAISCTNVADGSFITAQGESSVGANVSNNYMTGIGYRSLWTATADYATAMGANSCLGNLTGNYASCFGYGSGVVDSSDWGNTNFLAIGPNAKVGASNVYSYGDGTIAHGFGTTEAQASVHVMGETLVDATGLNDYNDNNFPQAGLFTGQEYLQTTGTGDIALIVLQAPVSELATKGSMTNIDVTIVAMDATLGTNGGATATTSAQVWFDGASCTFISTPTASFNATSSYSTASADWGISGCEVTLFVSGSGSTTNWVATYEMFSSAQGLTP